MCNHCRCDKKCHKKRDISGIYAGKIEFPTLGTTEAMTVIISKDGSFTWSGLFEYPTYVGVPGFSDLEAPAFGQWKYKGCGKYEASYIQRRQGGEGDGLLGLLGLSGVITSSPNYMIYGGFEFVIENDTFIATKSVGKFAHAEWSLGSGLPEAAFPLPTIWALKKQPISAMIASAEAP